jgi:hypothetical protein
MSIFDICVVTKWDFGLFEAQRQESPGTIALYFDAGDSR